MVAGVATLPARRSDEKSSAEKNNTIEFHFMVLQLLYGSGFMLADTPDFVMVYFHVPFGFWLTDRVIDIGPARFTLLELLQVHEYR